MPSCFGLSLSLFLSLSLTLSLRRACHLLHRRRCVWLEFGGFRLPKYDRLAVYTRRDDDGAKTRSRYEIIIFTNDYRFGDREGDVPAPISTGLVHFAADRGNGGVAKGQ